MLSFGQAFGHQVRWHVLCGQVIETDLPIPEGLSDEVVPYMDVLATRVIHRIFGEFLGSDVVDEQFSFFKMSEPQFG